MKGFTDDLIKICRVLESKVVADGSEGGGTGLEAGAAEGWTKEFTGDKAGDGFGAVVGFRVFWLGDCPWGGFLGAGTWVVLMVTDLAGKGVLTKPACG